MYVLFYHLIDILPITSSEATTLNFIFDSLLKIIHELIYLNLIFIKGLTPICLVCILVHLTIILLCLCWLFMPQAVRFFHLCQKCSCHQSFASVSPVFVTAGQRVSHSGRCGLWQFTQLFTTRGGAHPPTCLPCAPPSQSSYTCPWHWAHSW